ncbi:MAG: VOC family protein [Gammaproteobacteria bacterium]
MFKRFYHVGVNVSNLERSVAFYEMLGFVKCFESRLDDPQLATMFGLPRFGALRFAMLRLGSEPNGTMLDMCEWLDPPMEGEPLQSLNRLGYPRLCFHVDDIRATYEKLKSAGVEFFYPLQFREVGRRPPIGMMFFRDPDGNILEVMDWSDAP